MGARGLSPSSRAPSSGRSRADPLPAPMTPAYLFPGMNPRETGCVRWAFARDTAEVRGLAHSARSKRTGFYTRPLPNPPHTTEPVVVVVVVRVVVVAIGAPRVVGVVVPIAAAQNTVAHVPAAPKAYFIPAHPAPSSQFGRPARTSGRAETCSVAESD